MEVNFHNKTVVVIGDLILDEYIEGRVERISPEAPVPVVELLKDEHKPGGAANVAVLLKTLGADVKLAGVVGADERAELLLGILRKKGIDTSLVVKEANRPTTVKTRIISRAHHIVRLDREVKNPIQNVTEKEVIKRISNYHDQVDAILIEDYDKGFITRGIVDAIKSMNKPIYVDPKVKNIPLYKDIKVLKPNFSEFNAATGYASGKDEESLHLEIKRFRESQRVETLIVTLGGKGMILCTEEKLCHIPAIKREVFDVTGAGDMVISAYTLADLSGFNMLDSAIISSIAAGIEVTKLGATPVTVDEINTVLNEEYEEIKNNIKCISF